MSICLKSEQSVEQFRHILAITFTKNSTAEMKERIVQILNAFVFRSQDQWNDSENAIYKMVVRLQPHLNVELVRTRSRELLSKILYDYPDFSVSTIDSFFQRIVRAFAFELGISMSFNVEVTLDECFLQTIDILYNRISDARPDLKDHLMSFMMENMEEEGSWRVDHQLYDLLALIYQNEDAAEPLDQLSRLPNLEEKIKEVNDNLSKQRHEVCEMAVKARGICKSLGLKPENLVGGKTGIYANLEKASHRENKVSDTIRGILDSGAPFVKTGTPDGEEKNRILTDFVSDFFQKRDEYVKAEAIFGQIKSLALLFDLKNIMDEIRERDNKFFLSDTNYKIHCELEETDVPFIYEKVGNRYRHFFIDEFQDTSRMQWDNLIPLLKNALAGGDDCQTILYGDVKQAIYRFRNGDSRLFSALTQPEANEEYLKLLPGDFQRKRYQDEPLESNFRSGGHIVDFNNAFFENLPHLAGFNYSADVSLEQHLAYYNRYYSFVHQNVPSRNQNKGLVSIQFKDAILPKDEFLVEKTIAAVKEALERGYKEKDIAVLTSSNENGSMLGRELTLAGFHVISAESLQLSSSPEVNFIISVLTYLAHPHDPIARLSIMNFLTQHQEVSQKEEDSSESFTSCVACATRDTLFFQWLTERNIVLDLRSLRQKTLLQQVHAIIRIFHLNATDIFVIDLIDNILKCIQENNGELSSFLDWWERKGRKVSLSTPGGGNAITINTVHKAKGLQYPVVIFPMTGFARGAMKKNVWYKVDQDAPVETELPYLLLKNDSNLSYFNMSADYEEELMLSMLDHLNKVYVAQTRAMEMMFIITGAPSGTGKSGIYNVLLDDFIHQNFREAGEKNGTLFEGFEQDEKDPLRFWYGDRDLHKRAGGDVGVENTVSQIYCSGFSLAQLSTHVPQTRTKEQEVGIVVHDFLAGLEEFPQNMEEVESMQFTEDQKYQDYIRKALEQIVSDEHWRPYFAKGLSVLKEVSLLPSRQMCEMLTPSTSLGSQATYRPDRVVLLENETVVIDYKTGQPSERSREAYEDQVAGYVALLSSMGYPAVRGEILYLKMPEEQEV